LPAAGVQGESGRPELARDEHLRVRAVQPGAPDRALLGPVHPASAGIEEKVGQRGHARVDEVFDVGSVQAGALDRRRFPVGPVHPATCNIQGDARRLLHVVDDHVLNVRPVQESALDAMRVPVGPIHPLSVCRGGGEEKSQPKGSQRR
jgi:hypothetical protein